MYCPKRHSSQKWERQWARIAYCVNSWSSKSCCYERPCYVTGVGEVKGQKLAPKLKYEDRYKGTGEAINMESAYSMKCQ